MAVDLDGVRARIEPTGRQRRGGPVVGDRFGEDLDRDDPVEPVHETRRWLNDATSQMLRNGLGLLGVSAPERM